jgi:hypothetical protein
MFLACAINGSPEQFSPRGNNSIWLALEDLPRPGKQPTITAEAKAWVMN